MAAASLPPREELAERLLRALEAGEAAGGENGEVTLGHLLVVDRESFPYADLRVVQGGRADAALRALWEDYAPLAEGFVQRAIAPEGAPVI